MTRSKPIEFKGYSIEQETDATFSVYHPTRHYVAGGFKSINEACQRVLWEIQ